MVVGGFDVLCLRGLDVFIHCFRVLPHMRRGELLRLYKEKMQLY